MQLQKGCFLHLAASPGFPIYSAFFAPGPWLQTIRGTTWLHGSLNSS